MPFLLVLGFLKFIAVSSSASAQITPASAAPGLVFVVTGVQTKLFLAGSLHFIENGRKHPWPTPLRNAYDQTKAVCFEVNPKELDNSDIRGFLLKTGRFPESTNLYAQVSEATRSALKTYVTSERLRSEISVMHPWLATLTISQRQFGNQGIHLADGIEALVGKQAMKDGKTLLGLESGREHFRILSKMTMTAQEELLRSSLASEKELVADLQLLESLWRSGDLAAMERRSESAFTGNAELRKTLLTERNRAWAEKLDGMLRQPNATPTLVVVGCLHLCGSEGLPNLLRQKGYSVASLKEDLQQTVQNQAATPVPKAISIRSESLPPTTSVKPIRGVSSILNAKDLPQKSARLRDENTRPAMQPKLEERKALVKEVAP